MKELLIHCYPSNSLVRREGKPNYAISWVRKQGCRTLLKGIMKHIALSKVKFVIKNQTRTRVQVSRYSGLGSFHPTASDCNICPARKSINVMNHINISKMKKYMIEKCFCQLTKFHTYLWLQKYFYLVLGPA